MIHHLSVGANDLKRARAFFDPVLAVLGLRLVSEDETSLDYGVGDFLFSVETPVDRAGFAGQWRAHRLPRPGPANRR